MNSLNAKKADFTKNLLLDAACELTRSLEINEISFKAVSEQAGISERTMFRHFGTRDDFLDTLTERLYNELNAPAIPADTSLLPQFVSDLYRKFESQPRIVKVLLSADLFGRVIKTSAKARLNALKALLSKTYPNCTDQQITQTAANLRYIMSASSWHYYRVNFEFDIKTSESCAILMVNQALDHLQKTNKTLGRK